MERLIFVVQELSHARDLAAIMEIVRKAARDLTGADGATFVLRDGDYCFYAEENAIEPLWKGRKFPMETCISGWVMQQGESAVIEDIYQDERIPQEAYRPTFVKSLAMVPIRRNGPIGAIGNYWAEQRLPTDDEVRILQALADTTSVAMENAQLYGELQTKIQALEIANDELNRFAWVASHDLQEPLRIIATQVELLGRRYKDNLDPRAHAHISTAADGAGKLQHLIQDLLVHAHTEKMEHFKPVTLSSILKNVLKEMHDAIDQSGANIVYNELPWVWGDPQLLERLFLNLLSNAIKFRKKDIKPEVYISCAPAEQGWQVTVEDNGIGIETRFHHQVFNLFHRLHSKEEYPGSGIGLATCRKIIEIHGGKIWLDSEVDKGTSVCFVLSDQNEFLSKAEAVGIG